MITTPRTGTQVPNSSGSLSTDGRAYSGEPCSTPAYVSVRVAAMNRHRPATHYPKIGTLHSSRDVLGLTPDVTVA